MLTRRTSLKLICSFISIFTLPKNAISKKSISPLSKELQTIINKNNKGNDIKGKLLE